MAKKKKEEIQAAEPLIVFLKEEELNDKMSVVPGEGEEDIIIKINEIENEYKDLVITGLDDTKGYEAVKTAHIKVKKMVTAVGKTRKALRSDADAYKKKIDDVANKILEPLTKIVDSLGEKRKDHEDAKEQEKLRLEIEAKKKIEDRKKEMFDVKAVFDGDNWNLGSVSMSELDLVALEDEEFEKAVSEFKAERKKLDKEEEERNAELERLRKEKEEREKKEAEQAAEIEALKAKLAAQEKKDDPDKDEPVGIEEKSSDKGDRGSLDSIPITKSTDSSYDGVKFSRRDLLKIDEVGQKDPTKANASLVEQIARTCHEANKVICEANGDKTAVSWDDAPDWQKESIRAGVMAMFGNPDQTPEQNHVAWMKHKENDGWVYGEVKDEKKKTHPCMVPYNKLPKFQRFKDKMFLAIVRSFE